MKGLFHTMYVYVLVFLNVDFTHKKPFILTKYNLTLDSEAFDYIA